jgi:LmbE family N-acetylglucosaminyl deacetylase
MDKHFPELRPKVVLGIAAHPDDLDFMAGGAIAKFVGLGAQVYYLILTDGASGSEDRAMTPVELTRIRRDEQRDAAHSLGLADVFFCDYPDGALENTRDLKRDIVRIIRRTKPDVVVAFDPSLLFDSETGSINHPDHRAAGQSALDAVFPLARDHMAFPELLEEGYEPHKTPTILLMNPLQSNYTIDISDVMDAKLDAVARHASQMPPRSELEKHFAHQTFETFVRIDIH